MTSPTRIPAEGHESKLIVLTQLPFDNGWFRDDHISQFWTISLKGTRGASLKKFSSPTPCP